MNVRTQISIDEELLRKVDVAAEKCFVSRSAYIAFALVQKMQSDALLEKVPEFTDVLKTAVDIEQSRSAAASEPPILT